MGTYVYGMRSVQKKIRVGDTTVKANLYSYLYKPNYSFRADTTYEDRAESRASNAFSAYEGGLVIVGDVHDKGNRDLQGAVVYTEVTSPTWADSGPFPGKAVGFVNVMVGNRLELVPATPWQKLCGCDREQRMVIKACKAVHDVRRASDHYPIIPDVTVDRQGNPLFSTKQEALAHV